MHPVTRRREIGVMDELLHPLARHAEQGRDLVNADNLGHTQRLADSCTLTNPPRRNMLNTPLDEMQEQGDVSEPERHALIRNRSPTGGTVSSQPEERDDMTDTQRNDIKARLVAACDTDKDVAVYVLRQRLANGSRPALAEALAKLTVD